jgi:hypothetical protein
VAVFVFFFVKNKLASKRPKKTTRFELSDREVTVVNDGARVSTQWSGFGECLESPNLFVLVDKTKRYALVFPKRVFPDESVQNWFRNQASQRPNVAASTADLPVLHSPPPAADGIVLNFRLGYLDYLNRLLISWRIKGILLALYAFMIGNFFYMQAHPIPNAVNSPAKTIFVFALPTFTVMMALVLPVVAFITWRSHTKYLPPRQFVLSADRIGIAEPGGTGFIPWTTYKYWLENRWCFVIWKGQRWDMFPKSAFTSQAEIEKCRIFLQQNLKRSRWFFL